MFYPAASPFSSRANTAEGCACNSENNVKGGVFEQVIEKIGDAKVPSALALDAYGQEYATQFNRLCGRFLKDKNQWEVLGISPLGGGALMLPVLHCAG